MRDEFRSVLRKRVDEYFARSGKSKHADWRMVLKIIFYLGGYFSVYAFVLSAERPGVQYFAAMLLAGLFMAGIGFNVAHDAAHGGLSSKKWVNHALAHSFTLIGAHLYTWRILHNVIHHTWTNVSGSDGDLETVSALRFYDTDAPRKSYHRFQHIYCFPLYTLTMLVWVFKKDYQHMNRKVHCGYAKPTPPKSEWVLLYLSKFGHYSAFLVLPPLVAGYGIGKTILGFLVMHLICGFALACVFALGHFVDGVIVVEKGPDGNVAQSWGEHQLRTSANFATDSTLFYWTLGGLNTQIEHHLFPKICHVHYRALAPIVAQTAREFGLPYHSYPTMSSALAAHRRYMKNFGQSRAVAA